MNIQDNITDAPVDDLSSTGSVVPEEPSLTDDIVSLIDDGRNLLEAEIQFQKTRAAFAVDRGRSGALYGVAAFAVIHLALVALVVGAVIGLTPLIGPLGATGFVVGVLLVAGIILALAAKRRFSRMASAYRDTRS